MLVKIARAGVHLVSTRGLDSSSVEIHVYLNIKSVSQFTSSIN